MRLPLYKGARAVMESRCKQPAGAHVGLWYEKFCNYWGKGEWVISGEEKLKWILTVTEKYSADEKKHYTKRMKGNTDRLLDLVDQQQGEWSLLKTEGRFVTGMGRPHPVENGFTWHPTLGTPYIPGSSLKGMVRNWVEVYLGKGAEDDQVNRIFGSKKTGTSSVGSVIFFDALPIDVVKLEADIMTPHYTEYYQDKEKPPADWYSPTPIPFLTVASGQTFLFAVAPRQPEGKQPQKNGKTDVEWAMEWMKEALQWIGSGAKTAVGYGRFVAEDRKEKEWKEKWEDQRKLAKMSPIRRQMAEEGYDGTNPSVFMEKMAKYWLPQIEMEAPDIRREIAQYLKEWYLREYPDQWRKPKKKNVPKVNQIKAVLGEL